MGSGKSYHSSPPARNLGNLSVVHDSNCGCLGCFWRFGIGGMLGYCTVGMVLKVKLLQPQDRAVCVPLMEEHRKLEPREESGAGVPRQHIVRESEQKCSLGSLAACQLSDSCF